MKDRTYTPEEIQKKFDSLPDDIKSLVYSADMLGLIQKIGEKYKLHIDQLGTLETETADVMTGFSKTEDFVKNISASLSIESTMATSIAKDISDGLFVKIRESMKKIAEEHIQEKPIISAPTPSSKLQPLSTTASVPSFKLPLAAPASSVKPPVPPAPASAPATTPSKAPAMPQAEKMLSEKTVSKPLEPSPVGKPSVGTPSTSSGQAKPPPYKADPYREPPE